MERKNRNSIIRFIAFIGLIVIAILEIFNILSRKNILVVSGFFVNILDSLVNVCIMLVMGITAFEFVKGKNKWLVITYIISMIIMIATTVILWC